MNSRERERERERERLERSGVILTTNKIACTHLLLVAHILKLLDESVGGGQVPRVVHILVAGLF